MTPTHSLRVDKNYSHTRSTIIANICHISTTPLNCVRVGTLSNPAPLAKPLLVRLCFLSRTVQRGNRNAGPYLETTRDSLGIALLVNGERAELMARFATLVVHDGVVDVAVLISSNLGGHFAAAPALFRARWIVTGKGAHDVGQPCLGNQAAEIAYVVELWLRLDVEVACDVVANGFDDLVVEVGEYH